MLTKKTDEGWIARALYRDLDGKNRLVQRSGSSQSRAQQALAKALRDRVRVDDHQRITAETKLAVLAEVWFDEVRGSDLSPSTKQLYRDRLDKQILPALSNVRIRELSVGLIDNHLAAVKAKHGPALARTCRSVLSGMCRLACKHDAMISNPTRDVSRLSAKPRKQPMGLSIVQLKQLLAFLSYDDAAAAEDIVDVIRLLAATGMRIGEALALEWDAVNMQRGTVEVRSTVIRLRGTGLIIKPTPKSTAGDRTLLLPSWTVTMLEKRKIRSHTSLVLPSQLGHLRDPSNTRRSMRRAFARAGYAGLTSHVFRKSVWRTRFCGHRVMTARVFGSFTNGFDTP